MLNVVFSLPPISAGPGGDDRQQRVRLHPPGGPFRIGRTTGPGTDPGPGDGVARAQQRRLRRG